jgi:hypothetical protein
LCPFRRDVILEINGKDIRGVSDMFEAIGYELGKPLEVKVRRPAAALFGHSNSKSSSSSVSALFGFGGGGEGGGGGGGDGSTVVTVTVRSTAGKAAKSRL